MVSISLSDKKTSKSQKIAKGIDPFLLIVDKKPNLKKDDKPERLLLRQNAKFDLKT